MKIAIVSDTHFGYGWDTDREDDTFRNAREAFSRTVDADLVLMPGDIYDKKVPKQEVLSQSIDCFNLYRDGDCNLRLTDRSDAEYNFTGTPVVAIHGTHERRTKGFVNPIELLDKMGYLLHLHNDVVVLEHEETGEKVAVHGMSGVPERYAPGVIDKFDPQPVEDAYNIFMFHQSIEHFVYTSQDHQELKMEHLPAGFDLLVDGHIHWYDVSNADDDKPLVLPGSTVSTQMRKVEAEKPKGYLTVDTAIGEVEFHALEQCRDQFYETVDVDECSGAELMQRVDAKLQEIAGQTNGEKRPLVRLILDGETDATVKTAEIRNKYDDTAILSVSKRLNRSTADLDASTEKFHESTKSIAERGKDLLRSKLKADHQQNLQVEALFELLAEERADDALQLVEELDVDIDDEEVEDGDGDKEAEDTPEEQDDAQQPEQKGASETTTDDGDTGTETPVEQPASAEDEPTATTDATTADEDDDTTKTLTDF